MIPAETFYDRSFSNWIFSNIIMNNYTPFKTQIKTKSYLLKFIILLSKENTKINIYFLLYILILKIFRRIIKIYIYTYK